MKVYDPTDEAIQLLENHSPMIVVKGLLNQLTACRQTMASNKDWDQEKVALLEKCFNLAEEAKQLLRTKGYGWTGLNIYETCKLVPDNVLMEN